MLEGGGVEDEFGLEFLEQAADAGLVADIGQHRAAGDVRVALAELGRDEEQLRARELVDRRIGSMVRFEDAVAARRLVGMLARKGYGAGLAYEVVREALAARGAEVEGLEVLPD
jgi:hypothetical protein